MVSEMQAIADFKGRGILRGGELYVPASEAATYARRCRERGLAIIGVEGFVLNGDALVPQQDLIADAPHMDADTWQAFRERSNRFSVDFLHQLSGRQEVVVNFTTLSEEEWREGEHKTGNDTADGAG